MHIRYQKGSSNIKECRTTVRLPKKNMESSCLGVWGFILKPRRARKLLETIDVYSGTREEESKALLSSNERLHQAPIYTT